MVRNFFPHLNVQTNSNLSWSFLSLPQLIEFWEKGLGEKKLNFLAIADYYPYAIGEFLHRCKEKKIKPVWGVKIFFLWEKKKFSATIYPQNSKGGKEIFTKLFAPNSPPDRVFAGENILNWGQTNWLIALEAHQPEDINFFASYLIPKNPHVFIGFTFFLLNPTQVFSSPTISRLLPFFAIKVLNEEDLHFLKLWKKTTFRRYFFPADTQPTPFYFCDTQEYFSHCTNDPAFYQLLLLQWQSFLTKISLTPSFLGERTRKVKNSNSSLLTLQSKCWQKLLFLNKEPREEYQKTLEKELRVIEKLVYVDYFLLFSEVAAFLRGQDIIIGPGRGSSVSSLVAYLLEITSLDPLQHKLFFERFLNEQRKTLPDIDMDVENQEEVFNYLRKKYSSYQVARIMVRKKIGWKTAALESAKVCPVRETELKKILLLLSKTYGLQDAKLNPWKVRYPQFFALVEKIYNLYYDTSLHPAGVIINERSLAGSIPVKLESDFLVSLFEEEQLAQLGFKKYDFLSLKETLGFVTLIKNLTSHQHLPAKLPTYQEVDLADPKTWELLNNLCLTGIFQLDTPAARSLFLRFRPQNFAELVLFLALNRPGARRRAEEIISQKKPAGKISFCFSSFTKNPSRNFWLDYFRRTN